MPTLDAFGQFPYAHEGPAFWRGSLRLTVLSAAYITPEPLRPLFGRGLVGMLECLNCPLVKDALSSRWHAGL
ncbi:hypothetical protein [Streptomyces sp. NWU339]|uniref:hypothetical protein n=1 Tax=Streptomyces sp. NWU339 TaxID=2185284 RepID=UPI0011B36A30|nr:hypothetical protein [Streptomyces sp. NWU339]